ncbi:hypothetical protein ACFSKW_17075 [Nonomuraea mangrovi]|uniref:Uncharacterized protein n=1 Tax=Nonomuraea mangrovi TaxID=2316207 RepID=A0ABW4SUA5_9ACTN
MTKIIGFPGGLRRRLAQHRPPARGGEVPAGRDGDGDLIDETAIALLRDLRAAEAGKA